MTDNTKQAQEQTCPVCGARMLLCRTPFLGESLVCANMYMKNGQCIAPVPPAHDDACEAMLRPRADCTCAVADRPLTTKPVDDSETGFGEHQPQKAQGSGAGDLREAAASIADGQRMSGNDQWSVGYDAAARRIADAIRSMPVS